MSELHADGYFAILPEWVLFADISANALKLYAILSLHCDYATRVCKLGRRELGTMLGDVSLDTVDRAKAELVKLRALEVRRERDANGGLDHNVYFVRRNHPDLAAAGAATPAATLAAAGAAHDETQPPDRTSSSRRTGRIPTQVDGKRVAVAEGQFAETALAIFNEVAGTRFGAKSWLKMIIGCHRQHPELTTEDHRRVIEEQFAAPWWKGDPTPAVIYGGGGAAFDRALNGVRGPRSGNNGGDDDDDGFSIYR